MGSLYPKTMDTNYFSIRNNTIVKELILKSFKYDKLPDKRKLHFQKKMQTCLDNFIQTENIDTKTPFGWKFGETLFMLPYLFDAVPNARVIHLIRDGRDVMLSRIEARFDENFHDPFNKVMIFGKASQLKYNNQLLDQNVIAKYRTELELIHWQTVIEFSKKLRKYEDQYLEIRYEDLCQNPLKILNVISDFIEVNFPPDVLEWANENISADRIGKWKKEDPDYIKTMSEIAKDTLVEYGYL